jgi:hypothetical protein
MSNWLPQVAALESRCEMMELWSSRVALTDCFKIPEGRMLIRIGSQAHSPAPTQNSVHVGVWARDES